MYTRKKNGNFVLQDTIVPDDDVMAGLFGAQATISPDAKYVMIDDVAYDGLTTGGKTWVESLIKAGDDGF